MVGKARIMNCPTCGKPIEDELPIRYRFLSINGKPQEVVLVDNLPGCTETHKNSQQSWRGPIIIEYKEMERE